MTDNDFEDFAQTWAAAYELCSRGKHCSPASTSLAFEALRPYELAQISKALTAHVRNPDEGRFGLTVADVVKQIDGTTPTADQIIGAAMKPTTALAVLCRIEIGSWNLSNWTTQQLRPHTERCIALMPKWKKRLADGELAEHEVAALERYGIELSNTQQLHSSKRLT